MALKRKPHFFDFPMQANEIYFYKPGESTPLRGTEGGGAIAGQIFISGQFLDELTTENITHLDSSLDYFTNEKPVFQRGDFTAWHSTGLKGIVGGSYNYMIPYHVHNQLSFKRTALIDSLVVCLIYHFNGIEEYNESMVCDMPLCFPFYMLNNVFNIPANTEMSFDVFSDNCYTLIDNSALIDGTEKQRFKWLRPANDKTITISASQGDVLFAEFI